MKKLVLMLAVLFSVSLFSCGSSNKANEENVVEDTTATCVDSLCCDSTKTVAE